jgi:luciferase-like monooxygenase
MKRARPKLHKISEEMKAWSAALAEEVASWPQVSLRPMFGFLGAYHANKIFAALPRTRTMDPPDSVAFKLPVANKRLRAKAQRDKRIHFADMARASWLTFAMKSDADVNPALEWLACAYEAAISQKEK